MPAPYRAIDVAKYFLLKADPDDGDLISNLKLQKLLYYAQGFHLALNDAPLLREDVEAWMHGPVVRDVYHEFKGHGGDAIPRPEGFDPAKVFDDDATGLLDEVYSVYGQFSAWKLREMTHSEPPWVNTAAGEEITHDAMRAYFVTQLNDR